MANPNVNIEDIDSNYVEGLKNDLSKLKSDLESIKGNTDLKVEEKKEKTEELNKKIKELDKKIEDSIKVLEDSIKDFDPDTADQAQKDQHNERLNLKEELENLKTETIKEITELRDSILKSAEEKGFFGKIWDLTKEKSSNVWSWVGEQLDAVQDSEKWKNERRKNTLRAAGFIVTIVGGVCLAYKGVKKLFGGDEDIEEILDDEGDEGDSGEDSGKGNNGKNSSWRKRGLNFIIDKLTTKKE